MTGMTRWTQQSLFTPDDQRAAAVVDGVVVRETRCRSLLNPFRYGDYSFNCYTGCANGCVYCYARFMQRFHPHDEAWGEFVDVKVNAVDALLRQLRRSPPGSVFTCSACDGWQRVERDHGLTRECCRVLLDAGFELEILTKSELVLRDLDLFAGREVRVGVTITTLDEAQARSWEPRASSVAARIRVLRAAREAGLETALMLAPLLPEIGDTPEALGRLFELAADLGVDRVWTDTLNARPRVWPAVQRFLRRERPDLVQHYERVLFHPDHRRRYRRELERRIQRARGRRGGSPDDAP